MVLPLLILPGGVTAPPDQGWNSQFCFRSQRIYNGGRICYISYVFMVPYYLLTPLARYTLFHFKFAAEALH